MRKLIQKLAVRDCLKEYRLLMTAKSKKYQTLYPYNVWTDEKIVNIKTITGGNDDEESTTKFIDSKNGGQIVVYYFE